MSNNSRKKTLSGLMILLILIFSLLTCEQPVIDNTDDEVYYINLEMTFYPRTEIFFYEDFGLFSTHIIAHSPDAAIGSFDITLGFDNTVMEYESSYSRDALINIVESSDMLSVQASDVCIGPGEYLELCTITWKAVLTSITNISLEANKIYTTDGIPYEPADSFIGEVKIVKRMGILTLDNPGNMEEETHFSNTMFIDSEDKIIKEYDLDIFFDPEKVSFDTTTGNNGVIIGTDGFLDTITVEYDKINITGINENGIGPGTDLEFLIFNWLAVDSGRTVIYCRENKVVTLDDVYIKPQMRTNSFSIFADNSNLPTVYVWLEPDTINAAIDDYFMTSLLLDTVTYKLAAYGIDFYYDPLVVELDTSQGGGDGIDVGADGFLAAANTLEPGIIQTTGFDIAGKGPSPGLELLRIYWKAIGTSELSLIGLDVKMLTNERTAPMSKIESSGCSVIVTE